MKEETLEKTGRRQLKVYVSDEAYELLKAAAAREGWSMSVWIDMTVKRELRTNTADPSGSARRQAGNGSEMGGDAPVALANLPAVNKQETGDFKLDL